MMIRIRGLTYDYPDGTSALNGVDLDVERDELAALIGRNGAGKSTLLLHLNGLLTAKSGNLVIDDMKVEAKHLKTIRKTVGIVFQNPDDMLFSATVYEDIAFGLRNIGFDEMKVKTAVEESLYAVDMIGNERKNPHHLSMGQKKKISIAVIVAMKPKVIVFDEPTSHLDPRGKKEIMDLIMSLKCTKIISTHDLELAGHCDTVHIMDNGRIVYSGKNLEKSVVERYLM